MDKALGTALKLPYLFISPLIPHYDMPSLGSVREREIYPLMNFVKRLWSTARVRVPVTHRRIKCAIC